ncbi:hypothetical protein [Streptomyces altiplanensis]
MQLMHTQYGVETTPLLVRRPNVLTQFELRMPLEVTAPRHSHRHLGAPGLMAPRQQVFQQHVAESRTLLVGIDIQREHMRDRAVGPVKPVGRIESNGEQVVHVVDALRVDDTPDDIFGLDDELSRRVSEKALLDDLFGYSKILGPAEAFQLHEPRHIRETSATDDALAILEHE